MTLSDTMTSNIKTRLKKKQVIELIQTGQLPQARDLLHQICEIDKRDAKAWTMLGTVYSDLGDLQVATDCFEKSVTIEPNYTEAWYNLGTAQQRLGQFSASIKALTRVLSITKESSPQLLAQTYSNLGTAFTHHDKFDKAVDAYRKALSLVPANLQILLNLANALKAANQLEEALGIYKQAVSLAPKNADIHQLIGSTYECMHRLDDAEASVKRAIQLNPDNAAAQLLLAQLFRRKGNLEEARETLEKALSSSSVSRTTPYLYSELGHVCDSLQDFKKAYAAWTSANQLFEKLPAARQFTTSGYLKMIEFLRNYYTDSRLSLPLKNKQGTQMIQSPVFLVGHPRSGTTLSEQILSSHPQVIASNEQPLIDSLIRRIAEWVPSEEEIPGHIDQLDENGLAAFRDYYWNLAVEKFGPDVRKYTFLDKLPLNIIYLGLIQRIFPTARILVALRDPRDVCLSCFMQAFRPNRAMASFYRMDTTARHYDAVMGLWLHYRKSLQLRWLEFHYEDLVADLESEARRLTSFLELEWNETILDYFNADRHRFVSTPSYRDIVKPVFSRAIGRWQNYETQLEPVLEMLAFYVHEFGYK